MKADRLVFLFGESTDRDDLDDEEVRSQLLRESFGFDGPRLEMLAREVIGNQIYKDDPPAVWATAQRLLLAGLDRDAVFRNLALALLPTLQTAVRGDRPLDLTEYDTALARLPLPATDEVEAVLVRITTERQGLPVEALETNAVDALGGGEVIAELVDRCLDKLVDEEVLAYLPADRVIAVAPLMAGVVLTHRVSLEEQRDGYLDASVDLAGFTGLDELVLHDGGTVFVERRNDACHWLGPAGWLGGHEPGDTIAVRVAEESTLVIESLPAVPPVDEVLVGFLRAAYDEEVAEPWLPIDVASLVHNVALNQPGALARQQAPLIELLSAAGLEARGRHVAHEASVWHNQVRTQRLFRVMNLCDETSSTLLACRTLDIADELLGLDMSAFAEDEGDADLPTLRSLLQALQHDDEALTAVLDEILTADEPNAVERATALARALVGAAAGSRPLAVAHWVAAMAAERAEDPLAAESATRAAYQARPDWPPVVERMASFATDRGDTDAALRYWRMLEPTRAVLHEIAELERVRGSGVPSAGRNDPCPCGSGRKYKQCHLGRTVVPALPERVGSLCRKAVRYAGMHPAAAVDVYAIADAHAGDTLDDPIIMDLVLTEAGWFERFLRARRAILPADEAALADAWLGIRRTVFEVVEAGPDDRLVLADLRTGTTVAVRERTLTAEVHPGIMVCARVVPDGETHAIVGGVFGVRPGTEQQLLAVLDDGDPEEIAAWAGAGHKPPTLLTRENEALVVCELVLDTGDAAAARKFLDTTFETEEADRWLDTVQLGDDRVIRAQLSLEGARISVSTMSEERADRVLLQLLKAFPSARVVSDTRAPLDLGAAARPTAATSTAPAEVDPEVVEQVLGQMERRWCDESVPALGGLTPRVAAADPSTRPQLLRLLASFEHLTAPAGALTMRVERLRSLLGL